MGGLRRDIGFIGAAFIALNGIVGAGIFAMPQALVEAAGPASPYLVIVFGALMVFVAMVFGELAGHFDQTGGPVAYTNAAFGPFAGFAVGWLYYLARIAALAANTNAFLTYAATFAPGLDQGALRLLVIGAIVLLLTGINVAGVKGAVRTLNAVTLLKFAPLLVLVGWGLVAFAGHVPAPQAPADAGAVGGVSLLLLYAFVGFEMATLTSGETSDAKRVMPRALVGTVIAIAVLYFLVQLAYVSIMQGRTPEGAPLAAAAEALAGPWAAAAMAVAAMVSIGGNLFASFLVTPRITFAMAEEGSLPSWFAGVHRRYSTPVNSILTLALIVAALAMSSAFVWLAIMASLARMFVYLASIAALLNVRARAQKHGRPLWGRVARAAPPLLGASLCLGALTQAKPDAWVFLTLFAAAGLAIYAIAKAARSQESPK